METILQTAIDDGKFKMLVVAVTTAGLVDILNGIDPHTLFAPNDTAFAKLPAGTVEGLLKNKEMLTKILMYHLIAGKVMSPDVTAMKRATTLQGQELAIDSSTTANSIMINNAKIVEADIECSNGVIHAIDTVLMPI